MTSTRSPYAALGAVATLGVLFALSGCTTIGALVQAYGGADTTTAAPTGSASLAPTGTVTITTGDCLNRDALQDNNTATDPFVPCTERHDIEIYDEFTLDKGDYPAVETLISEGTERCRASFAPFVGLDFGVSTLDFRYYYPTESSWNRGDRTIDCAIFDPLGPVTGTLKHADR